MSYKVVISPEFQEHIAQHARAGRKPLIKKIDSLMPELANNPRSGTGKPEQLRHMEGEVWSRRIDSKHRLIYEIIEDELVVIAVSAYGHYGDK